MNRSLLLVICDFLLLSLLALAKFDEPEDTSVAEAQEELKRDSLADQDLIDVLRMSLESEQDNRNTLSSELEETQEELEKREQLLSEREQKLEQTQKTAEQLAEEKASLEALKQALEQTKGSLEVEKSQLEQEKDQLANRLDNTRSELENAERDRVELAKTLGDVRETSAASAEKLKMLQSELEAQRKAAAELKAAKAALEAEKQRVLQQQQTLQTKLRVAETEAEAVRRNLQTARSEIEITRQEKAAIQEQAQKLAEGVSVLAESTDQIRKEVKESQPISLNTIFNEFKTNRVQLRFAVEESLVFGAAQREYAVQTILVTDGEHQLAVMHESETPFRKKDLLKAKGYLLLGGKQYRISQLGYLAADPRLMVAAVPKSLSDDAGIRAFRLCKEPLRFPEAVVVDSQESYYGESVFKLLPEDDRYLKMQSTIVSRLFGEFSPTRSDLVFAKTGELMGAMVNNRYGVFVSELKLTEKLRLGDTFDPKELETIRERQAMRLGRLQQPLR